MTQPTKTADRVAKPTMFESIHETFDSIAIAFILAFLFRTFEAEAFVIPTGSMALTLMGAHKELPCPECGYIYKAGASTENPEDGDAEKAIFVTSSTCPNCRFTAEYEKSPPPTYNGDRILVTKYPYEFGDPKRFDVAVFKNPGQANQNYIKRVVGLPNEEVLIYRGDIYSRADGAKAFTIARKPPEKIVSVAQVVYDNDFVLKKIIDAGWPQRWQSAPFDAPGEAAWQVSEDMKSFRTDGKSSAEAWLRYRHFVPTSDDWRDLNARRFTGGARSQLITDFCEYNTSGSRFPVDVSAFGMHWVSDLLLECELEVQSRADDKAEAVLELVEGGRAFQCRIQLATGDVTLRIEGVEEFQPQAKAAVAGPGPHKLRFGNVDDHLLMWVNDKPLTFDASTNFLATNVAEVVNGSLRSPPESVQLVGDTKLPILDLNVPKEQDLKSPVGIAAHGAALTVSHLRVLRDAYYISNKGTNNGAYLIGGAERRQAVTDYADDVFASYRQGLRPDEDAEDVLHAFMSDVQGNPKRWLALRGVTFKLDADRFFVLGDNSAHSLDGRLWDEPHYREYFVKRELLIGKALFVYWPHGLDHVQGTSIRLPSLPFIGNSYFPNFGAMRLIR